MTAAPHPRTAPSAFGRSLSRRRRLAVAAGLGLASAATACAALAWAGHAPAGVGLLAIAASFCTLTCWSGRSAARDRASQRLSAVAAGANLGAQALGVLGAWLDATVGGGVAAGAALSFAVAAFALSVGGPEARDPA